MSTAQRALIEQDLAAELDAAASAGQRLLMEATAAVRLKVLKEGRIEAKLLEQEQQAAHGLSWLATYVETLGTLASYTRTLTAAGQFGEMERLIVTIGAGEYLAQILGGIPMSQTEIVRLPALGVPAKAIAAFADDRAVVGLVATGNTREARARLSVLIEAAEGASVFGATGLDESYEAIREEMRRFSLAEVAPHAHGWHLANDYIPMEIIEKLSELGVFSLTLPEAYGGMGLGKEAMCVVSEELSRGYIGVGSLGTRTEIACELIIAGGTEEQKAQWLPKLATGEILPTAVFTEPNTGSDLASLRTRAMLEGDVWKVSGNKTWITHPVRADVMTMLVRTKADEPGYKGLSILLAEKPRGSDADPFPAKGMSGGEIEVLGYRGMKEYELAFDGFEVKKENLLGGIEGQGFKQLMQTFESARIQTAARAIGVAQAALDLGLRYAQERIQFGQKLAAFPRVSDKLALMAVEIALVRQLTYAAAKKKDEGQRCDIEAGMAKLLGARVAWASADNALQIHGGNGFALEYEISRVLCDARILNIFEGAAEIQAQVIARRLIEGAN